MSEEQQPATAPAEKLPYVCATCGKNFPSLAALKGHSGATGHKIPAKEAKEAKPEVEEALPPVPPDDELAVARRELAKERIERQRAEEEAKRLQAGLDKSKHEREMTEIERRDWIRRYGYDPLETPRPSRMHDEETIARAEYWEAKKRLADLEAKRLEAIITNPQSGSPDVSALRQEISELRGKLDEEKEKRAQERLQHLETSISELKNEVQRSINRSESVYGLLNTTINNVSELIKLDLRYRHGIASEKASPVPRERVGASKIAEMLPRELIDEEGD